MSNVVEQDNQKMATISQEEADIAASQEERERLLAENAHLKNRVVVLRALVNKYQPMPEAEEAPDEEEGN